MKSRLILLLVVVSITYAASAPSIRSSQRSNQQILDYNGFRTTQAEVNTNTNTNEQVPPPRPVYLGSYFGKDYYTEFIKLNWVEAKDYCSSLGITLVKVATPAERDYLIPATGGYLYWTSGIDVGTPSQVHWDVDRSPITVGLFGGVMTNTAIVLDSRTGVPEFGHIYTVPMSTQAFPLCELLLPL